MTTEKNIQNSCLILASQQSDTLIFRQHVGTFWTMDKKRTVKIGVPGFSDALMLSGVTVTPDMVGKKICIASFPEFKTRKGRASEDQKNFQVAVEKLGAEYRLIRTEVEMLNFINQVRSK